MLRGIFLVLFVVMATHSWSWAVEPNPRVDAILETFSEGTDDAQVEYLEAVAEAATERAKAVFEERERAIRDLKRLVNRRGDIAEQALIYKQVLRLDSSEQEAVEFFTAIGTIEQVLADIEPILETDLLGNPIMEGQEAPLAAAAQVGGVEVDPKRFATVMTQTTWKLQQGNKSFEANCFRADGTWNIQQPLTAFFQAQGKRSRISKLNSGTWKLEANYLRIEFHNGRTELIALADIADGEWRIQTNNWSLSTVD